MSNKNELKIVKLQDGQNIPIVGPNTQAIIIKVDDNPIVSEQLVRSDELTIEELENTLSTVDTQSDTITPEISITPNETPNTLNNEEPLNG